MARRPGGALAVGAAAVIATALSVRLGLTAAQPATAAAARPGDAVAHGKSVYDSRCVECHGAEGKGDGPASFILKPRPRDFTLARYKIRTTETGSLPTDADLVRSVAKGLQGSAMPAWEGVLPDPDISDVVQYLKTLSPRFGSESPRLVSAGPAVAPSAGSVGRGARVYEKLQCGKCHGTDGRGTGAAATAFEDDWGQPLEAANLTEPWTFRGGSAPADLFMRFRSGMAGTPMPSFKDTARDDEMWDLANFVVSLARKPVWSMTAGELTAYYARLDAEARSNPVKRGRYLVNTLGCVACHTPLDREKRAIPGLTMAGGLRIVTEPFGEYPSGNLTSDKDTGLGNWTDAEIKAVITRGVLRDGTRLLPYPMDWASYSTMPPDDLGAIVAYLRTIPPIANKVPRPTRPFLPRYLWGKFKMLVLGIDPPMIFYPGNAGSATSGRTS